MKIGIFSECYKPTMNGVVISISTFKNELKKMGHVVYIFAPKPKSKQYQEEDEYIFRVPSIRWPGQKNYPLAFPYFTNLKPTLEKLDLDIIHAQHLFTMGKLGRKMARRFNTPIVYTYHTLLVEYAHYVPVFKNLAQKYLIRVSKNYCNSVDQVITPTQGIKDLLKSYGVKKPIKVLPTGIITKDYPRLDSSDLKKSLNIPNDHKILLFVGRLAEEKNIIFLFNAFQKISAQYPKSHLVLVGGGDDENYYKHKAAELKIEAKISFCGFRDKKETNRIFGESDIFLMPSKTETQGIVVAEAMAAQTPPVAINKYGPSEIIENEVSGFLVKPDNINQFVEKTLLLLNNDVLRQKMAKNAHQRAFDFDSQKKARELVELYHDVIANKKGLK